MPELHRLHHSIDLAEQNTNSVRRLRHVRSGTRPSSRHTTVGGVESRTAYGVGL